MLLQDDPDVFALLHPLDDCTRSDFQVLNSDTYVPTCFPDNIGSREATPAPIERQDLDYLALRFSAAKNGAFTVGRLPSCNVVLQRAGVSRVHCKIVLEEDGVYIENKATFGTAISRDCHDKEPIAQGGRCLVTPFPGSPLEWKLLAIHCSNFSFSLFLLHTNSGSVAYQANVQTEMQFRKSTLPSLSMLELSGTTTLNPGTPGCVSPTVIPRDFAGDSSSVGAWKALPYSGGSQYLCAPGVATNGTDAEDGMEPQTHRKMVHQPTSLFQQCVVPECWFIRNDKYQANMLSHYLTHVSEQIVDSSSKIEMSTLESLLGIQNRDAIVWLRKRLHTYSPRVTIIAEREGRTLGMDDMLGEYRLSTQGHTVSMRATDFWLSATDLMTIGRCTKQEIKNIRRICRKNTQLDVRGSGMRSETWISFPDGLLLCEYLKLEQDVDLLLEHGREHIKIPLGQNNYLLR